MQADVFSKRLNEIMKTKKIKQVDLIRRAAEQGIKLGKSQISQYVSGKTLPRHNIMTVLAEILGVEAEWLRGDVAQTAAGESDGKVKQEHKQKGKRGSDMREFGKSTKLDNVLYDVRGRL